VFAVVPWLGIEEELAQLWPRRSGSLINHDHETVFPSPAGHRFECWLGRECGDDAFRSCRYQWHDHGDGKHSGHLQREWCNNFI
jgi:hypothetical protein